MVTWPFPEHRTHCHFLDSPNLTTIQMGKLGPQKIMFSLPGCPVDVRARFELPLKAVDAVLSPHGEKGHVLVVLLCSLC